MNTPRFLLALVLGLSVVACGGPVPNDDGELAPGPLDALDSTSLPAVSPDDYVLPSLSVDERKAIVAKYGHLDPGGIVPRGLLEDTMIFFDVNKQAIPKKKYFVVVDFSRFSGKDRFFLVDLETGAVEPHKVAHGDGSDPDHDGFATMFSNVEGSHMSSLGFYLTGEIYDGTHKHSMRLDGLSPDGSPNDMANTNVRQRLVVVHEASYVDDQNTSKQGRSNGCLALDPSIEVEMVDRIHDGTLIYGAISPLNPPVGPQPDPGGSGGSGQAGAGGSGSAGSPGGEAGAPGAGAGGSGPGAGGSGSGSAGAGPAAGSGNAAGSSVGAGAGGTPGASGGPGGGGGPGAGGSPVEGGAGGVGQAGEGGETPGEAGGDASAGAAGKKSSRPTTSQVQVGGSEEVSGCSHAPRSTTGAPLAALATLGLMLARRGRASGRRRAV